MLKRLQNACICSFMMLLFGCRSLTDTVAQPNSAHEFWVEDSRTANLESVMVGALPQDKLDGPSLLKHYNNKVKKNGLAGNCRVVLQAPPEMLNDKILWSDLSIQGILSNEHLQESVNIKENVMNRENLSKLNLRQFLWLICRAYHMEVMYENAYIVVGYGFASHSVLSPGRWRGTEVQESGSKIKSSMMHEGSDVFSK